MSPVMKLYNRMILNRLNGFRQKRTTIGQIVALRRLIEGVRGYNLPCILTFIDFRKAFYTIHWGMLIEILRAYCVPDKMIEAVEATYSETWAKVRWLECCRATLLPHSPLLLLYTVHSEELKGGVNRSLGSPFRNVRVGELQQTWSLT